MNYNSINTKIRNMRGNLLKYEDYLKLSNISDINEFIIRLKKINLYKNISNNIDLTINKLEYNLDLFNLDTFIKIYNFVDDNNIKNYLKFFVSDTKFKFIKYMLFSLYEKKFIEYEKDDINKILLYDKKIDVDKIVASKNINSFVESFKDSKIYEILSKKCCEKSNLFDIEMSLDLYYYMNLWKLQNKLDKKTRNILKVINGIEIDIQNINLIYRFKLYYNSNKDLIYTYLIPINYHLSKEEIIKMLETKTIEELKNEILNSYYGKYFNDKLSLKKINNIILKNSYDKIINFNRNSIATILEYIFYKNLEIKNLITILECIRYNLTSNEIMEYIITK